MAGMYGADAWWGCMVQIVCEGVRTWSAVLRAAAARRSAAVACSGGGAARCGGANIDTFLCKPRITLQT